ncbi:MAG: (2Fe-2S)-binding protein [Proteobacteria bacterium]|jgi:sarcosine oxidase subunit alpha|nr:(2Fe-2S)-binding protein [Pseudomonadota bacterium]
MSKRTHMRLAAPYGSLIDRERLIRFRFDGECYNGYAGDTIASALAANGVRTLSRSFKYHRPRGIHALAGNDANCLVQVGPEPNVRADARLIEAGLNVSAQNVAGNLAFDWGRAVEAVSRFLPVGFYYHAFYKPGRAWRFWEPVIRRMAGLGRVERSAEHETVDHIHRFADVAVIGGGAAGMSAALSAAAHGARVIVVDDGAQLGGALNHGRHALDAGAARAALHELRTAVAAEPRISVLSNATCSGWFADNWLAAMDANHYYKIRAGVVIAATGVIEQPAVFRNNDAPGVMLASAAQRLMHLYGVKPGTRAVVLTATAAGYGAALDLLDAGIEVAAVVDMRDARDGDAMQDALHTAGVEILHGHVVSEALTRKLGHELAGAVVRAADGSGQPRTLPCDLLCVSAGWMPAAQLVSQAGGDMTAEADGAWFVVRAPADNAHAMLAGAVNGRASLDAAMADGRHAGALAAHALGLTRDEAPPSAPFETPDGHAWPIVHDERGRDFVDVDEDLQVKDIEDAVIAGYTDINLVKRYSTAVMGPSQGRYSAANTLRIALSEQGAVLTGARLTTQRPPILPEPIAHLAGRDRQPLRRTPMHDWHLAHGARMMPAGSWHRPAYYGEASSTAAAAAREAAAVHQRVGLIDVSTLGKIEVRGPDAAQFLERIYTFRYAKQPLGRLRYVLMTDEAGIISDDGIAARFAEDFFYVTATTTGVDAVYRQMLRWQAQWQLEVDLIHVTSAWAAINVAGPAARELLAPLVNGVDLSATAFGFSECREGLVGGLAARLMRVGFVGELGWEVHVPAHHGDALWRLLMARGAELGVTPVGIEAQRLLRLEKGHIIVGQDSDGLSYPEEVDMNWAVAGDKPFFVGQRAIEAMARRGLTRRLVGFRLPPGTPVPEECSLTLRGNDIVGRVTSVAYSEAVGHIIGLAYVAPDMAEVGARFDIKLAGGGARVSAEVVPLPFYDADNARQKL